MEHITVEYNDSVREVLAQGVYGARLGQRQGRLWLDFYLDRVDPKSGRKRRVIVSRIVLDPQGVKQLADVLVCMSDCVRSKESERPEE